jgi:hypothetical protein
MRASALGVVRPNAASRRGRYSLRGSIAKGGLGIVYRAFDTLVGREVAYKRLRVGDEAVRPRLSALFQHEYDVLTRLAHPRILEAYEYGVDHEGPFYTMELLEGPDLAVRAPMTVAEACLALRDVASALGLLHARRLVHRDLSAMNVRLTSEGRAKIVDFSAIAPFGPASDVAGTPAFIAPESLDGGPLDQRTDLYALGVLAYWVLVKRRAFPVRRVVELREAWTLPVTPPSRHVPEIPRALDELVSSLLHLDPLERPRSAAEVMERLTAIANLPPEEDARKIAQTYLARPPLVGRYEALERLDAMRRSALDGNAVVARLDAAPGLGRTAILDEVAMRAQSEGTTLLRVRGGAQGGAFGLASALTKLALASHPQLETSLADVGPAALELARANVVGADAVTRTPAEIAERHARLLSSIPDFLLELSDLNPLVIMVDDGHRADAESLGLLTALAYEAKGRRLFILASGALDAAKEHGAYARLVEDAERITLAPLEEAETIELVATVFGGARHGETFGAFLHAHGGGRPRTSLQIARLLVQRGVVRYESGTFVLPTDPGPELVPPDLDGALVAQVGELGETAARIAELLSIEDEALALDDLVVVSGRAANDVLAGLDHLFAYGVLARADERFEFTHESLGSSFRATIAPDRLRAMHQRAGDAILASTNPSVEMQLRAGHHLVRGGSESKGAEILARVGIELAYKAETTAKAVPALEAALAIFERSGRTDRQCVGLLAPICVAGYYGDPSLYSRYLDRTFEVLLYISGTRLAAKLGRFLGRPLALAVGLGFAFVRHFTSPRAERIRHFRDVVQGLFGIAAAGSAAASTAYDPATTFAIARALEPYAILGRKHPANIARELCIATAELVSGERGRALERLEQLFELLNVAGRIRGLDDDIRRQMLSGVIYCRSITESLMAAPRSLARAASLEREGLAFYRPHAEMLREYYFALRGEQHLADPHRHRAEVLALRGGSSWSAGTVQSVRSITIFQWTRDEAGLVRVIADLDHAASTLPTLVPYRRLAQAYVELLRGRADEAVRIYESVFADRRAHPLATLVAEHGRYAEALNALALHERARDVCEAILSGVTDADRRLVFATEWPVHQLALAEAGMREFGKATRRLDALLEETLPSGNPLLIGSLHRDRAQVALLERDQDGLVHHARAMEEWFRGTRNPSLIAQCERLAASADAAGMSVTPFRLERFESEPSTGGPDSAEITLLARRKKK